MKVQDEFSRPIRDIANVWIPLKDGSRLACRIWLPLDADDAPVPGILEYIPYRKRDFTTARDDSMHAFVAGHGYAVLRVDMRGAGDSDGVLRDEYLQQELDDAVEIIAWMAQQRWCTGAVGMMGISWGGFNALQVAAMQPPALKAIITCCSTDDRYADDMHYRGGCLLNDNFDWGLTFFAMLARAPDPQLVGERWREMWLQRLQSLTPPTDEWLRHQLRDEFWKHGSVCEDYSRITCPVFAVGGWLDGYHNAVPRLLANLSVPRLGLIGPWAHTFPHLGLPGPQIGFLQEAVRWWDYWLKRADTGIMKEPMLRVFMGEATPAQPFYDPAPGRWVAEETWPSARIQSKRLGLGPGRLFDSTTEPTALQTKSPQTNGLVGGEWCPYGTGGKGPEFPGDQREDDGRSLVFDSEPLTRPLELLGAPKLTLELAVDRPVAFVVARLCDVAADGASTRVSYGVLNLTHRDKHQRVESLQPGERYSVELQLDDLAYAFQPGHRVRLALSTTYWPMVWPSPEPVTLTVHTGESALLLPVRPRRAADADLRPFDEAVCAPPARRTPLREGRWENGYQRDAKTGRVTATALRDDGLVRVEANGMEIGSEMVERISIVEGDPLSAETEMSRSYHVGRGSWLTRLETELIVRCDKENFHTRTRLVAYEGDAKVFEREWRAAIARNGI